MSHVDLSGAEVGRAAALAVARQAKATRMATVLLSQAPATSWLCYLDDPDTLAPAVRSSFWLVAAQTAGVRSALHGRVPSSETVALVVDMLRVAASQQAVA